MTSRQPLWIVCVVAVIHGSFFLWYQSSDWTTSWSDQDGYRRLGQVLATTGKFTRFPDAPAFVPEVIRTPAYPIFVASIYKVFGEHQSAVAIAQIGLFTIVCMLVYAIARRLVPERIAWLAALATALFSPIPYFAALTMTEVWTTLWFTLAMWLVMRAIDEPAPGWFVVLGVVCAIATLSRPVFVLFPFALAAVSIVVLPVVAKRAARPRPALSYWGTMLASFAITMLPWLTYNYVTLGAFTLSPAGGIGRGMWEGSWQATWSGRLQNELTHLADDIEDRAELDRRVAEIASRERLPVEPMLEYVHQWEDIRRIWVDPTDANERARARVVADQEYLRVALENIRRDSAAHLAKRLARGIFVLWAGQIPFRYSEINDLPPWIIGVCWTVQALIVAAALYGVVALARSGQPDAAAVLAAPIVYVTAVHFPLLTEARQSLPAMPVVLLLATIGVTSLISPRTASS
jgi:Dolichyl-phosphate-mannose-protein mannosyltransferase